MTVCVHAYCVVAIAHVWLKFIQFIMTKI